ncbi:MAG: ABC transporter ATP-binding protein [Lentisphaerae bacterium]|nr:ABC transporter ATP-binding protein [Lentisphaerota bacterium]
MSLIEVHNVIKNYIDGKNTVEALRGVDIKIETGEFTAIAGPSGSGKTTLLNLIGGLDTVTSGTIKVDDVELSAVSIRRLSEMRLHKIGFVFQSYNLMPVLSALENVEFTMMLQSVPKRERTRRAKEILDKVGLSEHAHRRPPALSGGQQQRVAVARAIVSGPAVVLADEPTANLDSGTGAKLLDLMRTLNKTENMTFIFSTHDPMVMDYATRLIQLHDGAVRSDEMKNSKTAG